MAISSGHTVIGLTATQIDGSSPNPSRIHIHNNDQQQNLFIGGADVTIANGLVLEKLDSIEFVLNPGEALYGVSSQGGHTVSWLRQTQY
jgi:hypothetical protein